MPTLSYSVMFRAACLALLSAVCATGAPAQESTEDWIARFPDDRLPELLIAIDAPRGRLQTFGQIARLGARAHEPLLGLLRVPNDPLPEDYADAFGDIDADAAWILPVLLEALPRHDAQPVVLELLRRLGPAAAEAKDALGELLERKELTDVQRRRVQAALRAVSGQARAGPAAAPEPAPPVATPTTDELLAALTKGPHRWPALQALMARDREANVAALERILLLRLDAATRQEADALLRVLQATWRARGPIGAPRAVEGP